MAPGPGQVQISFPRHSAALLDSLNRLRLQGKFCDVAVHAGGRVFAAHRSVLAAASPFFHDKLLLQDAARLALPPAIDAGAFEGLLELIYCGRLSVAAEALPGHLLVASGLQMWHVVERCLQILRQLEGGAGGRQGRAGAEDGDGAGRGPEGSSVSAWDGHGGDEAIRGLDGSIHALDGSIHGLDGCPSSLSEAIHGLDGSLSSSSSSLSSLRANRGREGSSSSSSSRAVRGREGSLPSSSRTTRGPAGSSRASHGGEGPSSSSSSSSSWILHGGGAVAAQLNHGGEGPSSSSSSQGSNGGQGSVHGDSGPVHSDEGPSSSSSSSSWAARAATEELLRLRVAGGTSPAEEILEICVDDDNDDDHDDDNNDDHGEDEGPVRVVLDDTTNAAVPEPFHVKAELDAAAAAAPPPSEVAMAAGWRPVDLHGNELPGRGAGPLHAPVRLGTAPADGKRFGCACGKRFAVRPKRDRHILLTLSLRPFACGACHKRFKLKHHLTEHMKTHDGARRGCGRARHRPGPAQHRPGPAQHRPGPAQHHPGPATRWAGTCWACE